MTTMTPAIRWSVPAAREDQVPEVVCLGAAAAAEAVAAATLLLGGSLPSSLIWPMAAVSHGLAAWLVAALPRARPSSRWLAAAAVLTVPIAGVAIAMSAATRGRGLAAALRRRPAALRPRLTAAALRRLAGALSPCDALASGDADERRSALSTLGRREDPEAIALLRRAVAGRDPDLALSAALVLDEIGERAERRTSRLVPAESRNAVG